jgi:hypothetical protein
VDSDPHEGGRKGFTVWRDFCLNVNDYFFPTTSLQISVATPGCLHCLGAVTESSNIGTDLNPATKVLAPQKEID